MPGEAARPIWSLFVTKITRLGAPGVGRTGHCDRGPVTVRGRGVTRRRVARDGRMLGGPVAQLAEQQPFKLWVEGSIPSRPTLRQEAVKATSFASTVPAVRPGAFWSLQYMLVCAITWSGGGAPHSVRSSVVCASLTSVAS